MPQPVAREGDFFLVLEQALAAHRAGEWSLASQRYAAVPPEHRAFAAARHGLGQIALQQGEGDAAEKLIAQALALEPDLPQAHYHLALALGVQQRWPEAAASMRAALQCKPHDALAWFGLGRALLADGRPAEAIEATRQALKFDRANPDFLTQAGDAYRAAGRLEDAQANYERALAVRPDHFQALANLGALLLESAKPREAIAYLQRAQASNNDSKDVCNSLGVAYRALNRDSDAERAFRRALALAPDFAIGWNGLATALEDQGRLDEAEAALQSALALDNAYASAWIGLGNVWKRRGRYRDALTAYGKALALAPQLPAAHWNYALALLHLGDLATGFAEFEWRMQLLGARPLYPDLGLPRWQGEPIAGKRIVLVAEQGLGDSLQFVRYAPRLAALGADVHIVCPPPLHNLLSRVEGVTGVSAFGDEIPAADFACPLMSLPHRCGTDLATIPADIPYLRASEGTLVSWQRRLGPRRDVLRVGLVWAGDPRPGDADAHRIDRRRSIRLEALSSWLEIPGVAWHSLQKGEAAAQIEQSPWREHIAAWNDQLSDFDQTAALVDNLDLIIAVDTAVVHLAGGLGKPVWVLSRFDGCWRWLSERDDSPWYPSLRLYRQAAPGEWAPVIQRIGNDLAHRAARYRAAE